MIAKGKFSTNLTVLLDEKKTVGVLQRVRDLWLERKRYFANAWPPERRLMSSAIVRGSLLHARYLFLSACLSRSGKSADQVVRVASFLAESYPHLLDPETDREHPDFIGVFLPLFPFAREKQEERLRDWLNCLRILGDKYGGDPRNIFLGINCRDLWAARAEVIRRTTEFPGVGHKIGQMMGIWFQEVAWKQDHSYWKRFRKVPLVAIDIWWMRLVWQAGLVVSFLTDHRDAIDEILSDQVAWLCLKYRIDHVPVAQGMWWVGAGICSTFRRRHLLYPKEAKGQQVIEGLTEAGRLKAKAVDYCRLHCPLDAECTCVVLRSDERDNRGIVGWDECVDRPRNGFAKFADYEPTSIAGITSTSCSGAEQVKLPHTD